MPDTVRTLAALQALLADNTAGNISAQDIRDFLVSVYPPAGSNLLIESQLLAADEATVSFVNIPQVYTDLQLMILGKSTIAGDLDSLSLRFGNGVIDAGANYDGFSWENTDSGSSALFIEEQGITSARITRSSFVGAGNADTAAFSSAIVWIPGYRGATRKSFNAVAGLSTADTSAGSNRGGNASGLWRSIAAITHIDIFAGGGDLAAGSRISLYGLGHSGN